MTELAHTNFFTIFAYMNGKEARHTIGVTRETLSRYVKTGKVRVRTLPNGRYVYNETDVRRMSRMKGKWPGTKEHSSEGEQIVAALGYDMEALRSACRSSVLSDQRRVVASVLKERGWTRLQTGDLLNRNHSSVTIMIRTSYLVEDEIAAANELLSKLDYGKEKETRPD